MTAQKDPYSYPNSWVLKNKLDIRNLEDLDQLERILTSIRSNSLDEAVQGKDFGISRLQSIHKHLFQDLYDWAGEIRTIDIKKHSNKSPFADPSYAAGAIDSVDRYIKHNNYFRDSTQDQAAGGFAYVCNELNRAHPFREGNGRTMRAYLKSLAKEAGYDIDFKGTDKREWYRASKAAFEGDSLALKNCFKRMMRPSKTLDKDNSSIYSSNVFPLRPGQDAKDNLSKKASFRSAEPALTREEAIKSLSSSEALQVFPDMKPLYQILEKAERYADSKFSGSPHKAQNFIDGVKEKLSVEASQMDSGFNASPSLER